MANAFARLQRTGANNIVDITFPLTNAVLIYCAQQSGNQSSYESISAAGGVHYWRYPRRWQSALVAVAESRPHWPTAISLDRRFADEACLFGVTQMLNLVTVANNHIATTHSPLQRTGV
jgi:hypothetical protein